MKVWWKVERKSWYEVKERKKMYGYQTVLLIKQPVKFLSVHNFWFQYWFYVYTRLAMYKKLQYRTVVTNNDERKPDEGELSDSCVLLLPEKAQISAAKQYISGEENISGQLYINSWSNELVSSRFLNLIEPKKLFSCILLKPFKQITRTTLFNLTLSQSTILRSYIDLLELYF